VSTLHDFNDFHAESQVLVTVVSGAKLVRWIRPSLLKLVERSGLLQGQFDLLIGQATAILFQRRDQLLLVCCQLLRRRGKYIKINLLC